MGCLNVLSVHVVEVQDQMPPVQHTFPTEPPMSWQLRPQQHWDDVAQGEPAPKQPGVHCFWATHCAVEISHAVPGGQHVVPHAWSGNVHVPLGLHVLVAESHV